MPLRRCRRSGSPARKGSVSRETVVVQCAEVVSTGRKRYISTDISVDAKVTQLIEEAGPWAGLLYTWMIPHAEEDGTLTAHPMELKMKVFPGLSVGAKDIEQACTAMEKIGLIEREEDKILFPVDSFYKYQSKVAREKRRTA